MQDVLSSKLEYFKNITEKGGTQPYQFSLHSGSLPSGLNLSNDGKISGTPTETGKQTFTIQVTDNGHRTESQVFELEIVDPLVITTNQLNDGIVGTPFDQFLSATGGFGDYQWEIYSGTLPDGLTFKNGQISGTPNYSTYGAIVFSAKDMVHLTVSGLASALARSFVMDGNNLGASISDLAPPALVILEITAGSAAPVQEHQFEITAQNVWTSGSSDFYHVPSSLIIRPRASSGIHAEVEKARIHKGEQIQIYGSIIPSLADKSVIIHLNNQVIETYTLQGGGFVDTTTIGTLPIGQYEFNASFIDNQSDMHESIKRQFTITKGISTLTSLRESAEIPTDDNPFNIYGILFPHMPNENVIIRVIDPSQHHTDHVVRTDMNGHYTFTQDAFTQTGEWTFKAYWMGNDQYIGCESVLITIPFGFDIGRVIILAGGEVQNNAYWDVTEKLTTDAYRAFKANGFSDEMIHYIINTDTIDINNDGKSDNVVDDYLSYTYTQSKYHRFSENDGHRSDYHLKFTYQFNKNIHLNSGMTFHDKNAETPSQHYYQIIGEAGLQVKAPMKVTVGFASKYHRKNYDFSDEVYDARRIDKQLNVSLTLSRPIHHNAAISLMFSTMYNDSNVNVFDYHRHITLFSINFGM